LGGILSEVFANDDGVEILHRRDQGDRIGTGGFAFSNRQCSGGWNVVLVATVVWQEYPFHVWSFGNYLDELPEFKRSTLEAMRQAPENIRLTLSSPG
jgi:hypothetical protein